MRVVFDLDETICVHTNRDYENAAPVERTIERMREMRLAAPDCEIIIHTARGMKSCGGDAQKAEAKNRAVTEAWLLKHDVPYDALVFGKPFADAYVDDKAVNIDEWQKLGFTRFNGYSGKPLDVIGRVVVKDDPEGKQRDWYSEANRLCLRTVYRPRVISWSFDRLFIRRVNGTPYNLLNGGLFRSYIPLAATAIREMSKMHDIGGYNDLAKYKALVCERGHMARMDSTRIALLCGDIDEVTHMLKPRTFCHGDYTPMNMLASSCKLYVIDPSPKRCLMNYLLDVGKFRAALRGLESALTGVSRDYGIALDYWDSLWSRDELEAAKVAERTMLVRVAGLAREKGDDAIADRLLEIEGETV